MFTGPRATHRKDSIVKEKLIFAAEVAVVFAAIYAFQKHVYKVPVIGDYLPGGQ